MNGCRQKARPELESEDAGVESCRVGSQKMECKGGLEQNGIKVKLGFSGLCFTFTRYVCFWTSWLMNTAKGMMSTAAITQP